LLIVMHRDDYSRRLSSFRFRFPHVLRMPENVQVADGSEPARARGMRQNLVYLSVLSQHHANEVQSIESPEEGARLLRFNSASDCRRNNSLIRFAIISIDVYSFLTNKRNSFESLRNVTLNCSTMLWTINICSNLLRFPVMMLKRNGLRDIRCFVPRNIYKISYIVAPFAM